MEEFEISKIYRSKRKTISLQITENSELVIRAPFFVSEKRILEILKKKSNWIETKKKSIKENQQNILTFDFKENQKIPFLGNFYCLKITLEKEIRLVDNYILFPEKLIKRNPKEHLKNFYKKELKKIISEKLLLFSKKVGVDYKSFRITSAKKRLGSCSSKNSLNFSWKIAFLPEEVINYIIIHELCHIKIKNHSKKFYQEVQKHCPDYLERKKWINENCYKFVNF